MSSSLASSISNNNNNHQSIVPAAPYKTKHESGMYLNRWCRLPRAIQQIVFYYMPLDQARKVARENWKFTASKTPLHHLDHLEILDAYLFEHYRPELDHPGLVIVEKQNWQNALVTGALHQGNFGFSLGNNNITFIEPQLNDPLDGSSEGETELERERRISKARIDEAKVRHGLISRGYAIELEENANRTPPSYVLLTLPDGYDFGTMVPASGIVRWAKGNVFLTPTQAQVVIGDADQTLLNLNQSLFPGNLRHNPATRSHRVIVVLNATGRVEKLVADALDVLQTVEKLVTDVGSVAMRIERVARAGVLVIPATLLLGPAALTAGSMTYAAQASAGEVTAAVTAGCIAGAVGMLGTVAANENTHEVMMHVLRDVPARFGNNEQAFYHMLNRTKHFAMAILPLVGALVAQQVGNVFIAGKEPHLIAQGTEAGQTIVYGTEVAVALAALAGLCLFVLWTGREFQ